MKLNRKLLAVVSLIGAAYTLSGCAQECLDQFDCDAQSRKDGGKRYTCVSNKCVVMVIPETGGGDGTTGGGDGSVGGGDGTTGGGDADAGTGGGTATDGGDTDAGTDTDAGIDTDAGTDTDAGMDMDAGTVATCSVCIDPACTGLSVVSCAAGETVCTIHTKDSNPSTRVITRACATAGAAQTAVASNPAQCANIEAGHLSNNTQCTFACDGVAFPDCNHPPLLVPDAGGLFDGGP